MKKNVDTMSASGGGDGPEAVTAALHEVLHLSYRKSSVKICVFIADAPPHGLESNDGFPNGDPDGRDPIAIAQQMKERGIVIYAVACEPALSSYAYARDFFMGIAEITSGKFINLGNAHLLPKVIVGGADEELAMERLAAEVEAERQQLQAANPAMSADEVIDRVTAKMASARREVDEVEVDMQIKPEHYDCVVTSASLLDAKSKLQSKKPAQSSSSARGPVSRMAYASPVAAAAPEKRRGSFLSRLFGSSSAAPSSSSHSTSYRRTSTEEGEDYSTSAYASSAAPSYDYHVQSATVKKSAVSREHIAKAYDRNMSRKTES
eukprot:TRINITY_DN224_c0_g1_i1.p1 TRINITY_DN224_c0_g1~~TRINITY_DN224_c0_g1_i1.p1  ORF type:complete len:321 (-),score=71.76 TRINITY_DN224_c0_g1_i1:289-1251(-)